MTKPDPEASAAAELLSTPEDALVVLDEHGHTAFASAAAARLLGGRPLVDGADIVSRLVPGPEVESLFDGRTRRIEARLRDATPPAWLELSVYPVPGAARGASADRTVVIARDVSALRRTREMREAFAGIVAHELRTPVTTIYGGAQLLADTAITEATRHEAALSVVREADRLYRLVEDLLVLARFDQPVVVADEPVLLQRFLPALVATEAARTGTPVDLHIPEDLAAAAGRQGYIEQVLHHLLLDALRVSPAVEAVVVDARQAGETIVVTVVDSGPTVDPAEASLLFELFHRSVRAASDASGANLGLFVCRRLVEAMGGEMLARPRPGGGMEVGFSLKVADGQGQGLE
jgi:signal transduction histidine kinase